MLRTIKAIFSGVAAETEAAIFDANSIRILEQRTREVSDAFEALKRNLAHVVSLQSSEDRKVEGLGQRIAAFEAQAVEALDAGDEPRAQNLAGKIAVLEDERIAHRETSQKCARDAEDIRIRVNDAARRLAELKRGVATARSAEALDKAYARGTLPPSAEQTLREAEKTLDRIHEKYADNRSFHEAMEDIEREIPLAAEDYAMPPRRGPSTSAENVLERLKARGAAGASPLGEGGAD